MPEGIAQQAAPTMSTALVIGIGGSGVQTLGRLRRALRDTSRPDTTRIDNVHLLAIDAVGQDRQFPPLPPDAHLAQEEYYSIIGDPAPNAYTYVQSRLPHDPVLRQSWDGDYIAPNEPLTDGLKRSRPLGDLAFEVNRAELQGQIESLFSRALRLDDRRMMYENATQARLPVFIAASTAGGTGSSGFLHVLHAVHRISAARAIALQVYPVLFLPRVFYDAVGLGSSPSAIREGHKANAYAFFAELEAAVTVEGFLDDQLARGYEQRVDSARTAQDLLATAFLINGQLSDGYVLDQPAAYQLAADALYALLLTDGNNRLGIEGTNSGPPGLDAAEVQQRRVYGSLGAFSIAYPGTTYRRYLLARTRAHLLDKVIIDTEANETQLGQPLAERLVSELKGLSVGVRSKLDSLEEVRDLFGKAGRAGDDVLSVEDLAGLQVEHDQLDHNARQATDAMTRVAPGHRQAAVAKIEGLIDDALAESGEGTEVLVWALDRAAQDMAAALKEASAKKTRSEQTLEGTRNPNGELAQAREDLQKAWTALAVLRGIEKRRASKLYADVVMQYATQIVDVQVAAISQDILTAARDALVAAHGQVRAAERTLRRLFTAEQDLWRRDDLAGKDAGEPGQTLFLVPGDVLPQVEESRLAVAAWATVLSSLDSQESLRRADGREPGRAWLRSFHRDLRAEGHTSGLRAIGSHTDARSQERTLAQFQRQLATLAETLAAPFSTLPTRLEAAAGQADAIAAGKVYEETKDGAESLRLQQAISQLGQKTIMPLDYEEGRARFQDNEEVDDPVLVIASTPPLQAELQNRLPGNTHKHVNSGDQERIALTTVLSGLTIGMVRGVDHWYDSYRQVIDSRNRLRERANQPPPHLKRSMRDCLPGALVRNDYREPAIADLIVRVVALPQEGVLPVTFESVRRGNQLLRLVRGVRVEVRDGGIVPIGQPRELGTRVNDWFDAIGRDAQLHTSIEAAWGLVYERAFAFADIGETQLLETLRERAGKFADYNEKEWNRLKNLPGATEETVREGVLRGSLAMAGRRLVTETLALQVQLDDQIGG